eukprot:CAMPEP_0170620964 /NCGR_PEP_ID=MMETSP0224-20130122/28345_2 /TAXON_ID=285029 /ORGANISM="Togula jolla, Strain CCCM 725" /LENGTH=125 /DNA_ID=CAMNT_0010947185 /DNA_START=559 /DNA_END=935 /DNA_ORIENTATION=-
MSHSLKPLWKKSCRMTCTSVDKCGKTTQAHGPPLKNVLHGRVLRIFLVQVSEQDHGVLWVGALPLPTPRALDHRCETAILVNVEPSHSLVGEGCHNVGSPAIEAEEPDLAQHGASHAADFVDVDT